MDSKCKIKFDFKIDSRPEIEAKCRVGFWGEIEFATEVEEKDEVDFQREMVVKDEEVVEAKCEMVAKDEEVVEAKCEMVAKDEEAKCEMVGKCESETMPKPRIELKPGVLPTPEELNQFIAQVQADGLAHSMKVISDLVEFEDLRPILLKVKHFIREPAALKFLLSQDIVIPYEQIYGAISATIENGLTESFSHLANYFVAQNYPPDYLFLLRYKEIDVNLVLAAEKIGLIDQEFIALSINEREIKSYSHDGPFALAERGEIFTYARAWHLLYYAPVQFRDELAFWWEEHGYDESFHAAADYLFWLNDIPKRYWKEMRDQFIGRFKSNIVHHEIKWLRGLDEDRRIERPWLAIVERVCQLAPRLERVVVFDGDQGFTNKIPELREEYKSSSHFICVYNTTTKYLPEIAGFPHISVFRCATSTKQIADVVVSAFYLSLAPRLPRNIMMAVCTSDGYKEALVEETKYRKCCAIDPRKLGKKTLMRAIEELGGSKI